MVTIILGAQWGDEGKGKIVDVLAEKADYVVRFNGGNNAGHTIINEYGKFANHLVPAGVFHKKAVSIVGNGVVVDPEVLVKEIEILKKAGITVRNRLFISPRCHLIMPYHKVLDKLYEEIKGGGKIGTTGRGIGPVYADKVSYQGIRIADLLGKDIFAQKLRVQVDLKNKIIRSLGGNLLKYSTVLKSYSDFGESIKPYVAETFSMLQDAIAAKKEILLEGAQGIFLDNDWGTYPYVTASTVVAGGITSGAGIPPQKVDRVIGVAKAYVTRVGEGPMPTELFDKNGERLATLGHEFGTTTGRQRRCGWFDAELIRFAARLNGFTEFIITKLDVLDSFERIRICTGYILRGKNIAYEEADTSILQHVEPVYITMKGWNKSIKGITAFKDLPKEAQEYIKAIEKLVGVRVSYISNGPKRDEIIKR